MANAVNGKQYCEIDVWLNINKIIKQDKLTPKGHVTFQASTCFHMRYEAMLRHITI